jgi:hypothetical protein
MGINSKRLIEFYEDKCKEDKDLKNWRKQANYYFSVSFYNNIWKFLFKRNYGDYSADRVTFVLDDEDLKYLYDKHKPLADMYDCKQKELKLKNLKKELISTKTQIKKIEKEQC